MVITVTHGVPGLKLTLRKLPGGNRLTRLPQKFREEATPLWVNVTTVICVWPSMAVSCTIDTVPLAESTVFGRPSTATNPAMPPQAAHMQASRTVAIMAPRPIGAL
jgi:hypothetical protein